MLFVCCQRTPTHPPKHPNTHARTQQCLNVHRATVGNAKEALETCGPELRAYGNAYATMLGVSGTAVMISAIIADNDEEEAKET